MALTAGQKVRASAVSMAALSAVDATSRTTTSLTYTSTLTAANICGVSFTAPPSGRVLLHWAVYTFNSAVNFSSCSPAVRTGSTVGSGTSFLAADDSRAIIGQSAAGFRLGASYLVTGLTAATVYNVALEHRVSGTTGTFQYREVTVIPQLA